MKERENPAETTEKQDAQPSPAAKMGQADTPLSPLLLSGLAVLLAVIALVASLQGKGENRLADNIANRLQTLEARMSHTEAMIATDKQSLMQAELKKLLFNIQKLSSLSDTETKAKISEVEGILQQLTVGHATKVKARVDPGSVKQEAPPSRETAAPVGKTNSAEPETPERASAVSSHRQPVAAQAEKQAPSGAEAAPGEAVKQPEGKTQEAPSEGGDKAVN